MNKTEKHTELSQINIPAKNGRTHRVIWAMDDIISINYIRDNITYTQLQELKENIFNFYKDVKSFNERYWDIHPNDFQRLQLMVVNKLIDFGLDIRMT